MPSRFCRKCGHARPDGVKTRVRADGTCGVSGTGTLNRAVEPCRCYCEYGDERVVLRIRGEERWVSGTRRRFETTAVRAEAEVMTLDGARWVERRFPVAVDAERAE